MKPRWTRILLGPYRSGKTISLLQDLIDHCSGNVLVEGDALLMVPSRRYQSLVENRAEHFVRNREIVGFVGLNIASFYQACSLILRRCGIIVRVIPETVRPALVARVLAELKREDRVEHILPIVDFVGTHAALLDLIDEFERAGLSPYDVLSRLDAAAAQSSRQYELALVYKGYWEELDRIGYLDNRRVAFKCREVLAARETDKPPLFGMVGVDGFDRFNHLQLQVLRELGRHSTKSTICFDYSAEETDEARREYMWKDSSFNDLRGVFSEAEYQWTKSVSKPELKPQFFTAFKTIDRFAEMDEIARRVKKSLVVDQTPAHEILVTVPSLRDYKGAIESAFDDAGVPYFVDESIRMMTLPVVQFALSLLRAFENDFSRSELIRTMSSRFFDKSAFSLSSKDLDTLDKCSLKEKVIGGRNEWLRVATEKGFNEQMLALLSFLTPPEGSAPLTTFVSWCEDVLSRCLVVDDDLHFQDPVQGWIDERALCEIQNLWAALVQEDAILYGDRGGFRTDYAGFLKKLLHVFEKANFRAAPAARNAVKITSVDLADNRLFDEVHIAGLVEGEFPRRVSGRGFVTADEVGRWETFQVDIHNPRMHPAFEFALFRSLLNRSRKRIVLTYPMWDMSGEELLPSFFLTGESLPIQIAEVPPYEVASKSPVSSRNYIAGRFWKEGSDLDSVSGEPSVADLYRQVEESVAMVRARAAGMLASPFNGYLVEAVSSGVLRVNLPSRFSASRLNEYGKCPFRYWMTHVLNLAPFEEASVKLEVRELGETYHLALEKFYDAMIREGLSLNYAERQTIDKHFQSAVEEALAWLERKRGVNQSEFWEYEKKEIVFRLKKFLEKEIDRAAKSKFEYTPCRVEAAFGMADKDPSASAPPLVVSDGKRRVEFRGKIDRIDIAGGPSVMQQTHDRRDFSGYSARVVDYKTGSSPIPPREANEGRNLQLPIYALAVERCVMPNIRVASGAYMSFTSGGSIGSLKFEPDKEDDRAFVDTKQIERLILNYVENMSRGVFTVAPNGTSVCENCDHKRVCRVSELREGGEKVDVSY